MFNRKTVVRSNTTSNASMKTPVRARFSEVLPQSASGKKTMPRLSMAPTSRGRLSFFKSKPTNTVDLRQMAQQNASKIHHFLSFHEEEDAIPLTRVVHPSGKNDFIIMLEMIYQHMNPQFQVAPTDKIEELVPSLFSNLGYPLTLKPSMFNPIGVPHSWPSLLNALSWLIDFVEINNAAKEHFARAVWSGPENQDNNKRIVSYSWMSTNFQAFMKDKKAFAANSKGATDSLKQFLENQDNIEEQVNLAQNQLDQIKFECDELESNEGAEASLLSDLKGVRDDIQKAIEYKDQLDKENRKLQIDLDILTTAKDKATVKISEKQKEVNEKKELLAAQESGPHSLTAAKARQLIAEQQSVVDEETAAEEKLAAVSVEQWNASKKFREHLKQTRQTAADVEKALNEIVVRCAADAISPMAVPNDVRALAAEVERVSQELIPQLKAHFTKSLLTIESETSALLRDTHKIENSIQIQTEVGAELTRKLHRENRLRERQQEELADVRKEVEKKILDLEVQKDLLDKSRQEKVNLAKMYEEGLSELERVTKQVAIKKEQISLMIREKAGPIIEDIDKMTTALLWFEKKQNEIIDRVKYM